MKKLLLLLMCLSSHVYPFADGSTDLSVKNINMLYGLMDIHELLPAITYYDMIIT